MYETYSNDFVICSWDIDRGEDFYATKKAILTMLREQRVSLAKVKYLFNIILRDIEYENPISTREEWHEWIRE